jgi:3-hydroxybutyryl-CoA dehydrogenase
MSAVAIIGSGAMGRGITEAAALAGLSARLIKATGGACDDARRAIAASLDRGVKRGKIDAARRDEAFARITFTGERDAVAGCGVIVESVVEDLGVKQALFASIEPHAAPDAVLATNTSSLSVARIGERIAHRARLLGLHFFSPVPAMKLVEIAPTRATAPFAVERAREFAEAIGKTPVLVGDTSGYIVNRLLVPYLLDGIRALEEEVAAAIDIDTAMRLGCGHPMGPLALADAIGLDVVYAMARTLYADLHDPRYSPPPTLRRLVLAHQLGKKSGAGIYDYTSDPPVENPALRPVLPGVETD